jgi:hypothetical protein
LHDFAADANAALAEQTGKILSSDWVGTTAAGVVVTDYIVASANIPSTPIDSNKPLGWT